MFRGGKMVRILLLLNILIVYLIHYMIEEYYLHGLRWILNWNEYLTHATQVLYVFYLFWDYIYNISTFHFLSPNYLIWALSSLLSSWSHFSLIGVICMHTRVHTFSLPLPLSLPSSLSLLNIACELYIMFLVSVLLSLTNLVLDKHFWYALFC